MWGQVGQRMHPPASRQLFFSFAAVQQQAFTFNSLQRIEVPVSTKMYCEGLMDQESQYLYALTFAASYRIEAGRLILFNADGNIMAEFTAVP